MINQDGVNISFRYMTYDLLLKDSQFELELCIPLKPKYNLRPVMIHMDQACAVYVVGDLGDFSKHKLA